MKPPPRTRRNRYRDPKPEATSSQQKPSEKWTYLERSKLLNGLRRYRRTANTHGDIPYDLLRNYVPTRSISEIRSLVDSLKTKVISRASLELKLSRRWEKRSRKPIEEWMQMASAVTGSLEKTISAAFCQMLKVSSTEPCTLRNCDPPQVLRPPTDEPLPGRTIPLRPAIGAVKKCKPCPPPQTPPAEAASTSKRQDPVPGPTPVSSAPPPSTSEQPPTTTTPTSVPSVTSTSGPPCSHPASLVSASLSASHAKIAKTIKYTSSQRNLGMKHVVDFEKLYMFLNEIQTSNEGCCLTPMESAIMLDLLMSLPEELPLLDCNSLKKHLLQVYQGLSAPANSNKGRELLEGRISVCGGQEAGSQSGQSGTSSSQSEGGAALNCCPPLNPFMVPLKLLMRK